MERIAASYDEVPSQLFLTAAFVFPLEGIA
jgi:hypothetical protein